MAKNLRHTALGIIAGTAIILILLMILPIKVIYDVPVETMTHPTMEWRLVQDGQQFRTELTDYSDAGTSLTRNFVFERGDVIDIQFDELIGNNQIVSKDDMLLQFRSMMQTMLIQRALNEIDMQETLRNAGSAAMKSPLRAEAKDAVELAQSNVRLQEINNERLTFLLAEGVISQSELDAQSNRLEVATQELKMAEKRLINTSFEQKDEDLAVYTSRIQSLDRELDVLLAQQNSYNLLSPFAGRLHIQPEPGVIIALQDTGRQTLLFPFPISERVLLDKGSFVEVESPNGAIILPFSLKNEVGLVRGKQQCLGVATLDSEVFSNGEIVTAKVVCDTVLLREYLFRKLL